MDEITIPILNEVHNSFTEHGVDLFKSKFHTESIA